MSYRAWGYLAAGLCGAWLATPPVLEAQQPAPSSRRTAHAPALLSVPAVGQASPLVPDDASPASAVLESPAQAAKKNRPSSRRQTSSDSKSSDSKSSDSKSSDSREPRLAKTAPQPKLAPQPAKLAPEPEKSAEPAERVPHLAKRNPQPAKLAPEPEEPAEPAGPVPHLAKRAPQPAKLAPEPMESNPEPSAVAGQPDSESSTRQGKWTQWEDGRALWTCEFRAGVRYGKATRYFVEGEGPLFAESQADGFEAPFEAQAAFVQGKLDGPCTIVDGAKRTLCQLSLKADELEGECVWFYPSGERREVAHYHAGRLDGKRLQYNRDAELVKDEDFLSGRPTSFENSFYAEGQKQMRGTYYLAGPLEATHFDWLRGELLTTVVADYPSDVRTGQWTWWHPNGQPQLEGHYEEDVPTGTFTWWYPNGQKQRQGTYADGLQSGKWSWWFATGQKQIEGIYVAGEASEDWQFWAADGSRIRGDVPTLAAGSPQQKPPAQTPRPQVARQPQQRKNSVR